MFLLWEKIQDKKDWTEQKKGCEDGMSKRVTVNMADDVLRKLIKLHKKKKTNNINSVSFSSVLNDQLRKVLK